MRHFDNIVKIVCDDLNIEPEHIYATPGKRSQDPVIHAARTAIVIAANANIPQASYPAIAKKIGFKSHGSLMNFASKRREWNGVYPGGASTMDYVSSVWARVLQEVGEG